MGNIDHAIFMSTYTQLLNILTLQHLLRLFQANTKHFLHLQMNPVVSTVVLPVLTQPVKQRIQDQVRTVLKQTNHHFVIGRNHSLRYILHLMIMYTLSSMHIIMCVKTILKHYYTIIMTRIILHKCIAHLCTSALNTVPL